LSITGGQIDVGMLSHGPDDPMCCPTQQESRTYVLQGAQLVETAESTGTSQP